MHKDATPVFALEGLETRRLFSGPALIGEQLLGGLPSHITGIQLNFAGPLDPTSAENVKAYHVYGLSFNAGSDGFGVFGFGATDPSTGRFEIQFSSATYDPNTFSVTLTTAHALPGDGLIRWIRINGKGVNALLDANQLSDGKDIAVHFFPQRVKHIRYKDVDGDLVKMDLRGPGKIVAFFRQNSKDRQPMLYILNGDPLLTSLTATVIKGKKGDGLVHLQQFNANGVTNQNLTTNPSFSITAINL